MKQKWIPRKMKEATWLGWSQIFGGRFFSSGSTCVYLSFFYNQLVMWKQTSVSYSTTHIAYPSWFFTRTSQCSIKMKKKMNTWNKINMDTQKIQMIQWRIFCFMNPTLISHTEANVTGKTHRFHTGTEAYRRGVYVTTSSTDTMCVQYEIKKDGIMNHGSLFDTGI